MKDFLFDTHISQPLSFDNTNLSILKVDVIFTIIATVLTCGIIGYLGYTNLTFLIIVGAFVLAIGIGIQFLKPSIRINQKILNKYTSISSFLTIVALHIFVPFIRVESFLVLPMAITMLVYNNEYKNTSKFVFLLIGLSIIMFLSDFATFDFEDFSGYQLKVNFAIFGYVLILSCFKVYLLFNWGSNYKKELKRRGSKFQILEGDFNSFMHEIPTGYCIYDEDANKIFCSHRSAEIFGYESREEFKPIPLEEFCHPDSIPLIHSHFEKLKTGDYGSLPFSIIGITKDNRERILEGKVSIQEVKGDKRVSYNYEDVTDVIKQRNLEKQRQALYSYVVQSSQDGILAFDKSLNILTINPVVQKGFKKFATVDLKVGDNLKEKLPTTFLDRYHSEEAKILKGERIHFQDEIKVSDSKVMTLDTKVMPMHDDMGEHLGSIIMYRDITTLKKTEKELKEKEKQARTIIDAIPGGIAIINLESDLEYVSPTTAEIFGYPQTELTGRSILNFFDQGSQERILSYVTELLNGLTPSVITLKGIKKDGTSFFMEGKGRIVIDEITGYKKIIGVFIDATDKLLSERQLAESEATLQAIFNSTSDSILAYDTDYNIIAFNKKWKDDITKFTNSIPTNGQNLSETLPPVAFDFLKDNTHITFEKGELSIQKKHSLISDMFMDIKSTKLLDNNNNTIGVLEVIRDVSELKKKELELLASKKVYQTIFEKSPISILTTNGPYIETVNPYFCTKYGYPENEVIGKPALTFVYADEINQALQVVRNITQDRIAVMESIQRILTKDGQPRYCLIRIITEFDPNTHRPLSSLIAITDIDELKESERLLKLSESKYKSLFNKTLTGIYITENGIIQDANPIFSELLGYDPIEVIGLKITHLLSEGEKERIKKSIESDIKNKKANSDLVTIAQHKKGRSIEIILRVVYQYDENGVYLGDFGSISDLSDLKFAEQALYESENRNKNLVETLPGGILECDLDGTISFASQNAGEIIGVDKDKLIGRSAFDFVHPDYVNPMLASFTPMISDNLIASNTLKLISQKKDRPPVYVDSKSRMLDDTSENNKKILTVFLDVSDEIKMRQDLNEQKAIMSTTIENAPDMIIAIDTNSRVIGYNKKSAVNLKSFADIELSQGAEMTELIRRSRLSEEYLKMWHERTDQVWKGKHHDSIDIIPLKNGKKLYFQQHMSPIFDQEKNVLGSIIYSRNVTKTKEYQITIENQLSELEKYIESNLQLENFAYIASHDLKAPLRTVSSFAYLLKNSAYDSMDDKSKEFLNIISESSKKMQILIDDLLTFSRTNTQKINIQQISFRSVLKEVLHQLGADIKQSKVDILIDDSISDKIDADPIKLSQLMSNLISNAIKFSSKNETPRIEISGSESDRYWYYSVEDNGIGIKEANREDIFKLFKKLHSNDVFEGTGLGLSICSKIVDQHKGEIWVNSELNKYSKFTFSISKKVLISN